MALPSESRWSRWRRLLTRPLGELWAERRANRRLLRLEQAVRARPSDERAIIALADGYRTSGRTDDALTRYWQAAQLYVSACHPARALAVLRRALSIAPSALHLRRAAAQTLERLGRTQEAAVEYRLAADIARRRGHGEDAAHLEARASMLAPPASLADQLDEVAYASGPPTNLPRAAPAPETGPEVPIYRVSEASVVDAIVAEQMHAAFGPGSGAGAPNTTELALDAEVYLLTGDPAEAATAQCSALEIHEIKTKTLVRQAEMELESFLDLPAEEDPTQEFEVQDPFQSYA